MKIIAYRPDGLGTRIINLVSARYYAETHGLEFQCLWGDIKSEFYSSDILSGNSIYEIFDQGKIFKDLPSSNMVLDIVKSKIPKLSNRIKDVKFEGLFGAYSIDFKFDQIQFDIASFISEDGSFDFNLIKSIWNNLNWNKDVLERLIDLRNASHDKYVAAHLRRGDIEKYLLHYDLSSLDKKLPTLLQRFSSIKSISERLKSSEFNTVVICGECFESEFQLSKLINKNCFNTRDYSIGLTDNQKALFDLLVLSYSHEIYSSSKSYFSLCASNFGKAKINIEPTNWLLVYRDIANFLDFNLECSKEKKALVGVHIYKNLRKDTEKIDLLKEIQEYSNKIVENYLPS